MSAPAGKGDIGSLPTIGRCRFNNGGAEASDRNSHGLTNHEDRHNDFGTVSWLYGQMKTRNDIEFKRVVALGDAPGRLVQYVPRRVVT